MNITLVTLIIFINGTAYQSVVQTHELSKPVLEYGGEHEARIVYICLQLLFPA